MLLRLAETLAANGDASRAREKAAEAMAIAEAFGDSRLTDACMQSLHAAGIEVQEE
jgi:hypothetical protein